MHQDNKNSVTENISPLSQDKKADILQATFKHYFEMAMDHHTKAATTSHILLIIVGAMIGLVNLDKKISGGADFVSGLAVFVIGCFGAVWAWKQHERYHYWERIAYEYQKELIKIVPGLKTAETYHHAAQEATAKEFGWMFAKQILDRYLWVGLHVIVVVIGFVLMAVSIVS